MLEQLRNLIRYGAVSGALFTLETALMLWLMVSFTAHTISLAPQATRLMVVLEALAGTGAVLIGSLGFQAMMHLGRARRERGFNARLEAWTELWMAHLWNGSRQPARLNGVSARHDPAAAEALLRLCEALRGEDARRASRLYRLHGLLGQDLEALWRDRDEVRMLALDNLARARHPASLYALERSFVHGTPDMQRLCVLTMARVCARANISRNQLVGRFKPKLTRTQLSSGTVERALVLLEGNSAPVLEAMLEPGADTHVWAALKALGLVQARELSELCVHWLGSLELDLRCAAARALYQLNVVPESAEMPLYEMLKELSWEARAQAVLAFSWVDRPEIDAMLLRTLGDSGWWVRHNSAVALSKRGPRGLAMLRQAGQIHPDRFARDAAHQQLLELGELQTNELLTLERPNVPD